jgi:hypothetical protein
MTSFRSGYAGQQRSLIIRCDDFGRTLSVALVGSVVRCRTARSRTATGGQMCHRSRGAAPVAVRWSAMGLAAVLLSNSFFIFFCTLGEETP